MKSFNGSYGRFFRSAALYACALVFNKQRVTVCRRLRDQGWSRRTSRAGVVLDCHGLAPKLREFRADGSGHQVRPTTGSKRLDHAHAFRWIVF